MSKKAICLFSGGLDSATTLYCAKEEGYEPLALSIYYGQTHSKELESAKKMVSKLGIEHEVVSISLPWGGSALLDDKISIPNNRQFSEMSSEIPVTYVPARNTIFLSLATSYAEAKNAQAIFIGANAIDYSGYPDCRPEYLAEFETLIRLGTKAGVEGKAIKIKAPLLRLKKSEIIKLAVRLGVPLEYTWSCYRGGERPCGHCDSCLLRAQGFSEAHLEDPALHIQFENLK